MYENYYYPQETLQKSLSRSFLWMTFGLLVTAVTSYFCYTSGWFLWMIGSIPMFSLILILLQFGLVFGFQASMYRTGTTGMKVLFLLYAFTLGISLSSLLFYYTLNVIAIAFVVSAIYFACLAFIGLTTKKDLTKIGMLCIVALFVMLISQVFMILFRIPGDVRVLSIVGLLIFTGLTAWDMQRMNRLLVSSSGDVVAAEKISIFMAFELYLDFINIFLYILRLLGNRNN